MDFVITEQLQNVLFEHIARSENGIAVVDANDLIIFHNDTFLEMFGLQDRPVVGCRFDDLISWMHAHGVGAKTHGVSREDWLSSMRSQYRSAAFRNFELDLVDGRWLLMTEQVNPSGEVVLVGSDITRLKQTEHALRVVQEELEKQAWSDELTGLPNRRHFMQRLDGEYRRALRHQHPSTLAILDLDHFKRINDQYGHPAGDAVLRHFAGLLHENLRKEDMTGRLGGEEFGLLLPETTQEEALGVLERIHQQLSLQRLDTIAPDFAYTFSAGLMALAHDHPLSLQEWISSTDQALYQAKAAGRNQVAVYRGETQ
ncbi:GGDEF domain-containing protein [Chromobacterium violaceum]|uniref:GGDEF domain-containing protein n=1 Tax=Chromobacterium violaceum TaxID=536 RepID=UPI00143CC6B7|nr:sensor domain-containing diguanylate cyclase [Chromobacterium violaceum]QIY79823.1 diguanylate cyclase [Chromobacterium violaceum]